MSCKHVSLVLRLKTIETVSSALVIMFVIVLYAIATLFDDVLGRVRWSRYFVVDVSCVYRVLTRFQVEAGGRVRWGEMFADWTNFNV